tara:strand:- start:220 stop:777 length:558 start_codon:yes stop_codon:yes gene_type:complete
VVVLRFIFALAVHTATTTAATVSVKEGADESHRQLGASDCKQRVGQEQSAGSCCNFCDNPGNGVDTPWWRPGANAKCDRDDLACAGCSECKTKHCRQREGHDQSAGSCCNFCALGRRGNKKKAPHNCKRQQKGAALYEYINEPCDNTRHTVCAALRMFDTVARPNQKKAGVCAEERERERTRHDR